MTFLLVAGIEHCALCHEAVGVGWRAKVGHVCQRRADLEQVARQARIDAAENAYDTKDLGTSVGTTTDRLKGHKAAPITSRGLTAKTLRES